MTPASNTPLDDEISYVNSRLERKIRFMHRIKAAIRDASTNCDIDGYTELPSGREWEVKIGDDRLRVMVIEL